MSTSEKNIKKCRLDLCIPCPNLDVAVACAFHQHHPIVPALHFPFVCCSHKVPGHWTHLAHNAGAFSSWERQQSGSVLPMVGSKSRDSSLFLGPRSAMLFCYGGCDCFPTACDALASSLQPLQWNNFCDAPLHLFPPLIRVFSFTDSLMSYFLWGIKIKSTVHAMWQSALCPEELCVSSALSGFNCSLFLGLPQRSRDFDWRRR